MAEPGGAGRAPPAAGQTAARTAPTVRGLQDSLGGGAYKSSIRIKCGGGGARHGDRQGEQSTEKNPRTRRRGDGTGRDGGRVRGAVERSPLALRAKRRARFGIGICPLGPACFVLLSISRQAEAGTAARRGPRDRRAASTGPPMCRCPPWARLRPPAAVFYPAPGPKL